MKFALEVPDVLLALGIFTPEGNELWQRLRSQVALQRKENKATCDVIINCTCFSMMAVCSRNTLLSTRSLLNLCYASTENTFLQTNRTWRNNIATKSLA
jgi:uncharacterized NAD(P)/FAD-binding protein YdhS